MIRLRLELAGWVLLDLTLLEAPEQAGDDAAANVLGGGAGTVAAPELPESWRSWSQEPVQRFGFSPP